MQAIEQAFHTLEQTNRDLMRKRGEGEKLTKEDQKLLKEQMKAIHTASKDVPVEVLVDLLDRYDIGMGMAHIEPSYERINYAFAFIEARDGAYDGDDD